VLLPGAEAVTVDSVVQEQPSVTRFCDLIRRRIGLSLRPQELAKLLRVLSSRATARGLPGQDGLDEYYELLRSRCPAAADEWQELAALLTIAESYFFRDEGQFQLLRRQLLPELMRQRAAEKSLRIWSAGCSTGEEPYSIAILISELLRAGSDWSVTILGTDLNQRSLAQAREALYGPWSLRALRPDQRLRFEPAGESWRLTEDLRSRVSFRRLNLIEDPFPNAALDLADFDLILCRNVFIYFDAVTVAAVVSKLAGALREGGYLLTGHAELHGPPAPGLRAMSFPESTVYRRCAARAGADAGSPCAPGARLPRTTPAGGQAHSSRPHPPVVAPATLPRLPLPGAERRQFAPPGASASRTPVRDDAALQAAVAALRRGDYREAIEVALRVPPGDPLRGRALFLAAWGWASLGDHQAASERCEEALEAAPGEPGPYLLLAQIHEERGAHEEAIRLLRMALYLDPSSAAAHLQLAELYGHTGDLERASRMRAGALRLLEEMPPDALVPPFDELRAGELAEHLRRPREAKPPRVRAK
jgi:chemotaxis protein methyltransferase CheR